jgi:pyruvate dehydrogenase E2 component (dihydrolipoamide acetyltransferase)
MATSVVMPALELAQETGKLVAWRKKEGDSVSKGEPLLEVETDKAVVEIEAPADGVLAAVSAQAGAVIAVGKTIAWILRPGETPPAETAPADSGRHAVAAGPVAAAASAPVAARAAGKGGGRISPKARRFAQEHGIDLATLHGSGSDGEILTSDVEAAIAAAGAPTQVEVPGSIWRLMAERTLQSWTTVPHFFIVRDVDAGALNETRKQRGPAIERERSVSLTHTDLLVALVARALARHPRVNASWTPKGIRSNEEINIGVAIAVADGVVATVIKNAGQIALGDISVQRRDLAERAKGGRTRPADIAGATFTISNLGMYHVDAFTAIISPPQAAILAVGSITDRVVPVDGRPAVRPIVTLTLSCDHRVIDGAHGALFMNDLADAVRDPETWLQ